MLCFGIVNFGSSVLELFRRPAIPNGAAEPNPDLNRNPTNPNRKGNLRNGGPSELQAGTIDNSGAAARMVLVMS